MSITKRRLLKAVERVKHLPGGINLFRYSLNKIYRSYLKITGSTKVAHPSSIMLEVTNHCNLKCITCPREYAYGDAMDKGFMDISKLKKVVDEAFPYIDSIGLTGLGETMMYKDLENALDYIRSKNKGIITFISINAHLPNCVQVASRLADKIDTIQISIDGVEEIYDKIRLRGDYSFFIKNTKEIVEMCKGKRADVMFNFVAIKENFHQMADIVQTAIDIGVRYVNITPVNVAAVTEWNTDYYKLFTSDEFKSHFKRAKKLAESSGKIEFTYFDFEKESGFRKCDFPWSHFYVSWDGWATPCCAKPFPKEMNFGNVFEDGLMNCLNNKDYRNFRKMWFNNETPDFCKKCHMIDMPAIQME